MKIKLKATNLSVGFIFLLTFLSSIASAETLVFEDNFDSYGSNSFPSSGGWNLKYDGYGASYQILDSSQSLSSPNSLKLEAQYNWASAADYSLSETPEQITYEVDVRIDEPVSIEDEGRANAQISIVDPDVGWGKIYSSVVFGVNGLVGDSPYNYNQWYHVKINLDMEKRTFDAWVDDKQIVTNLSAPTDGYYKAVRLCAESAGHTRVWFDNVKVTQRDSSPSPEIINESEPVRFIGEVTDELIRISFYGVRVRVDEIISDPTGKLKVGETLPVWATSNESTIDASIGDRVEVFGVYRDNTVYLENADNSVKEQSYFWFNFEDPVNLDCGNIRNYFTVSRAGSMLGTNNIKIDAETGEVFVGVAWVTSLGPSSSVSVSKIRRGLDTSKGMIEIWPWQYNENNGLKIYYRVTPYSAEINEYERTAWIYAGLNGRTSLTGDIKDFFISLEGSSSDENTHSKMTIHGGGELLNTYSSTEEGNVTKENIKVGDEIKLEVPSGNITLRILEIEWNPWIDESYKGLDRVKVDYKIEKNEVNDVIQSPDLIIEDILWSPEAPDINEEITFTVIVKNNGLAPSESTTIDFYIGDETFSKSVLGISPGMTSDITFTWTPDEYGIVKLKAVIKNEENINELSKELVVTGDFTIVHCSDVHIGAAITDPLGIEATKKRENFLDALRDIEDLNPKPEIILFTGDLAETLDQKNFDTFMVCVIRSISNYQERVFCVPGNHDRRTKIGQSNDLTNYSEQVDTWLPFIKEQIGGNGDYMVNYKGFLFIGLDSGEDFSCKNPLGSPEGSGLDSGQYIHLFVPEILNYPRKIIFMHHPVISDEDDDLSDGAERVIDDPEGLYGGNNHCIAHFRPEFIRYCINDNVDMVLTGHTHYHYIFNASGDEVDESNCHPKSGAPYFIQTQSLTKDEEHNDIDFTHGYRIININDGVIEVRSPSSISLQRRLSAYANCPVTLHVYDSKGQHTGYSSEGGEFEIPDSYYFAGYEKSINDTKFSMPESIILYDTNEDYNFEIRANFSEEDKFSPENQHFNFTLKQRTEDKTTNVFYENISLTENTIATLPADITTTNYKMSIDDDGDGIEDRTQEPTEVTIEEENEQSNDTPSSDDSPSSSSSGGSGGSSGGSGGGGGAGGSPEPSSNVEIKELSQQFITNGNHVKFLFPRNVTCITYVAFDPKKTAGKTTTIVEMLKGKSTLVPELPSGKVYENANIWVGNKGTASPENIENAVVGFRVEKSWLDSNGVDAASVRLWRFDSEKWGELFTNQTGKDDKYVYFEATTPGFSPFSITALSAEAGAPEKTGEYLVAQAAESKDNTSEMSGGTSKAEENISNSSEASKDVKAGSGILKSIKKVLLVAVLLSATVLLGFLVLRKQD